jgi:hypothetical protein
MKDAPIWMPLASLALALTWLLPNANPPWISFHKEAWIGAVLWVVLAVFLFRKQASNAIRMTPPVGVLLLLAALSLVQWSVGITFFLGHALLGAGYFLAAALCLALAHHWESMEPNAVGDFLFGGLLIAALATGGLMLAQWFQVGLWGPWIQLLPNEGRPFGNLIQPNHAATLLVLGLVALMWTAYRKRLGIGVACLGGAFLTTMVLLTGSRTGLLSLVTLMLATLAVSARQGIGRRWLFVLLVLFLVLPIGYQVIGMNWSGGHATVAMAPDQAFDRDLTSVRLQVYSAYSTALSQHPWLGVGFRQTLLAQIEMGDRGVILPGLFTWAHNAVLDLALWFGVPVALLSVLVAALTTWYLARAQFSSARCIYLAGAAAILIHGMVELPLAYAYFLLPLCLLLGAAQAGVQMPSARISLWATRGVVLTAGVYLSALWFDYLRVEQSFYTWRFKQNNIGTYHPMDIPDTVSLDHFEALLIGLRAEGTLGRRDVDRFREAVMLEPSASALQQLAELQVRIADFEGAQRTADTASLISSPHVRRSMALRWAYLETQFPEYKAVKWKR